MNIYKQDKQENVNQQFCPTTREMLHGKPSGCGRVWVSAEKLLQWRSLLSCASSALQTTDSTQDHTVTPTTTHTITLTAATAFLSHVLLSQHMYITDYGIAPKIQQEYICLLFFFSPQGGGLGFVVNCNCVNAGTQDIHIHNLTSSWLLSPTPHFISKLVCLK